MKKSMFTEEQIAYALRGREWHPARRRLSPARGQRGTFYIWKKKYAPGGGGAAPAALLGRGEWPAERVDLGGTPQRCFAATISAAP